MATADQFATASQPSQPSQADIVGAQKAFYNNYNQQIQNGTNDLSKLPQYMGYAHYLFNDQTAKPNDGVMQQLSIKALNGDSTAQNYLKTMNLTPLSGASLWNGIDPSKDSSQFGTFATGGANGASNQYMNDNPYSGFTKQQNMDIYNQYSNIIKNGGQLDSNQENIYNDLVNKWNLKNMNNPYDQYISNLQQDKTSALNAQDTALNQSLSAADANNFQNMLKTQQTMTNRGIADSGLAQDAYARATMAANQDYQKAFADAATQKATLATNYDKAIGDQQVAQLTNQQQQQAAQQKAQSEQDQFLTTQTGYVYIGGRPLMQNGQPMTTLDWQKMSETARHDLATEALTQQQNTDTYNLGVMNNATNQQKVNNDYNLGIMQNNTANSKIQADLNIKGQQLQLDWANYGLNDKKTQASIDNMIKSAQTAATNADTGAFKAQASAVADEMTNLRSQMNEYVSKGKDIPADLQDQFNKVLGKYQGLVNSMGN